MSRGWNAISFNIAATEREDVAHDQVVQMDAADPAAAPAADARKARVQPRHGEGRERCPEHQEERFAPGEAEAVEPDCIESKQVHLQRR